MGASSGSEHKLPTVLIQLQERERLIEDLHARLSQADSSLETLTNDASFFRSEYNQARDRVIAEMDRTTKLEEQVARLREQLTLGLTQRDLHFDAVKAQRVAENDQYRMQNKLLLDQARLTDDVVRRKAAQFGSLKSENDRLKESVWEEEQKVAKLQKRNEELVDQVEVLRARAMGIFGDDEDDSSGTEGDSSSPLGDRNPAQSGYNTRPDGMTSSGNVYSSSQVLPDDVQMMDDRELKKLEMEGVEATTQESVIEGGAGARCKWREDGAQCVVVLDSLQVRLSTPLAIVLRLNQRSGYRTT